MDSKKKKYYLIAVATILMIIGFLCKIYFPDSDINNTIRDVERIVIEEIQLSNVVVTDEILENADETIEATKNLELLETNELIEGNIEEEQFLENELENDAQIEQENISYNGDSTGDGLSLLGAYQGVTYYSQADSRWASIMYSSVGDKSQTMKSSACRTNVCFNDCKFK